MEEGKLLAEQALQIAEKRREAKGKEEREKYTQLNAEVQRTARREKKVFSEQCKEKKYTHTYVHKYIKNNKGA